MPRDELPPDPEALEKWREMPQNKPSRSALPPATGGSRWTRALLAFFAIIIIIMVLVQLVQT